MASWLLCMRCTERASCPYIEYTKYSESYNITLQPLEFLHTNYNKKKDIFVIDEAVGKKENLHWDFNFNKICNLINIMEELLGKPFDLKDYLDDFLEIHRTLLKHTSSPPAPYDLVLPPIMNPPSIVC